jgi:hypothetical protein
MAILLHLSCLDLTYPGFETKLPKNPNQWQSCSTSAAGDLTYPGVETKLHIDPANGNLAPPQLLGI